MIASLVHRFAVHLHSEHESGDLEAMWATESVD